MMEPSDPSFKRESQLDKTQKEVDEVVQIMKNNVEGIMQREGKLSELDERANNLTISASEFQTTSRKIQRKYWWKNIKMMIILGLLGVIVIAIIIVAAVGFPSGDGGDGTHKPITTTTPLP